MHKLKSENFHENFFASLQNLRAQRVGLNLSLISKVRTVRKLSFIQISVSTEYKQFEPLVFHVFISPYPGFPNDCCWQRLLHRPGQILKSAYGRSVEGFPVGGGEF